MGVAAVHDALQQLAQSAAVHIGRDMMKLIDGEHTSVEHGCRQSLEREPQGRMRTDQHRIRCIHEGDELVDLAAGATRRAEIVLRIDCPVSKEAKLCELSGGERRTNRPLRHGDNHLLAPLVVQLVEPHKHERTGLTRCRWRLHQQVLCGTTGEHSLLHRAHTELVGIYAVAGSSVFNAYNVHRLLQATHASLLSAAAAMDLYCENKCESLSSSLSKGFLR